VCRETPQFNEAREVQCLTSAVWLMKRELYDRFGGLDEVYNPLQFEDLDFCYRVREQGYRVWYEPACEMYHFENVTGARTAGVNFPYVTIKNGLEFKRRWRHMFSREDGPPEEVTRWRELETQPLEKTGIPPLL
jgi:GT2 family glycosyltransferase